MIFECHLRMPDSPDSLILLYGFWALQKSFENGACFRMAADATEEHSSKSFEETTTTGAASGGSQRPVKGTKAPPEGKQVLQVEITQVIGLYFV